MGAVSGARKTRLVDCNPHWVTWSGQDGIVDAIRFDCPEGHEGCGRTIPFTPALDGSARDGTRWGRVGDTFETLTLSPSIAGRPRYPSREAAIAAGCIPEHVTESMLCAIHIFIRDGAIEFCGDSR